jgi:hypothetical protein
MAGEAPRVVEHRGLLNTVAALCHGRDLSIVCVVTPKRTTERDVEITARHGGEQVRHCAVHDAVNEKARQVGVVHFVHRRGDKPFGVGDNV